MAQRRMKFGCIGMLLGVGALLSVALAYIDSGSVIDACAYYLVDAS